MAVYELAHGGNNGRRGGAVDSLGLPTVEGRCSKVGNAARPWWCCWWEEKDGGAAAAMDFTAAALLCSAAVQGGERRIGKEKQASEWRERQQARRWVIHCDPPRRVGAAPVHCFHAVRAS